MDYPPTAPADRCAAHEGAHAHLPLQDGTCAQIDACFYEALRGYTWTLDANGYVRRTTTINDKPLTEYLHRLVTFAPPGSIVDHISGDKTDNRGENLRLVTHAQNAQNKTKALPSTTGARGVSHTRTPGRFRAYVTVGRKQLSLGTYGSVEEAARAAEEGRRQHMTHSRECQHVA